VNAANVFVRCRIYSLLCGSIARPVFVLLDDPLSFFWPKKKVSKEKARPASPLMARNAIDITRGILPLGLKAAPMGVAEGKLAQAASVVVKTNGFVRAKML
jgi:hypothetical protein